MCVSCVCACLQCRQCLISYWAVLHVYMDRPEEAAALVYKAATLGVDVGTLVPDPGEEDEDGEGGEGAGQ